MDEFSSMGTPSVDFDNSEESVSFGCPPLMYRPSVSLTSQKRKSNTGMMASANGSKLHCDRAIDEAYDHSRTVMNSPCPKSPACSTKEKMFVDSIHSRTRYPVDKDDHDAPVSKQAKMSLCTKFYNLSLASHEQSEGFTDLKSDCDTLKANTSFEANVLKAKESPSKHLLDCQSQQDAFYVGKQGTSVEEPLCNPEQISIERFSVLFWNIDINLDNINVQPDQVTEQDQDGDTILHYAVINENIHLVKEVLQVAADYSVLNILNDMKQTALHLAVLTHQPHIVRLLISHGASIDIRDRNGNTALHLACQRGCLTCVQQLTKPLHQKEIDSCNYHVPFQRIPQDPGLLNYDGQSCVHMAAAAGSNPVLDHLLSPNVGHNVNIKHGRSGRTILHEAVCSRNLQLVIHLLRHKVSFKLDVDCKAFDGSTPLQMALCNGNKEAALLLKRSGAVLDGSDVS